MGVRGETNLILPNKGLYVGIDESNHGRYTKISVAAMSRLEKDVFKGYSQKKENKILIQAFLEKEIILF